MITAAKRLYFFKSSKVSPFKNYYKCSFTKPTLDWITKTGETKLREPATTDYSKLTLEKEIFIIHMKKDYFLKIFVLFADWSEHICPLIE